MSIAEGIHKKVVRIGIIGCGRVAFGTYVATLKLLRGQRRIEISAVCDVLEAKWQAVLDEYDNHRVEPINLTLNQADFPIEFLFNP